jgi:DnaJ-like protein
MTSSATDFLTLFQELGLPANCTLDELKLAFRRRVSQLHPDRASQIVDAESRLQRLTTMYNAALDFHRRYGRMPGVTTHGARKPAGGAMGAHIPNASRVSGEHEAVPAQPQRSSGGLVLLAVLAALAVIAWLIAGSVDESTNDAESTPPAHVEAADPTPAESAIEDDDAASPRATPAPRHLRLGMTRDAIIALEGEPLSTNGPQWDYGPSWIAFRCGRVADWYSSPLRPLRTASTHPLSTDQMPALRAVDCANDP